MFDLVIVDQKERTNRLKAVFYARKENYKNNIDFISYSRIENDLSDALHEEILVLRKRHESKLQRDYQWHFYKPLVHYSSTNVMQSLL